MLTGTGKAESNFERIVLEEGTYPATLTKAVVMMGKPTQFQPEGAPKILMVWAVEVEGETYEVADYLGFPKNIAYNEKSKFWAKVGEIMGVKVSSENAGQFGISFGKLDSFIDSYGALIEHISTPGDNGKNEKAEVARMTWGAEDMLGVKRQLVLKIWEANGNSGNDIAAIMGAKKSGGVRKQGAAVPARQAAQAAPSEAELLDAEGMPF